MKKNNLAILGITVFIFLFFSCDTNVNIDPDASIDPALYQITMGPVTNQSIYVQIPLEVYGTSPSSLTNASITVYSNNVLVKSNVAVAPLYFEDSQLIIFQITGMSADSVLGFVINKQEGSTLYYEGTVSAKNNSYANLSTADFSFSAPIPGEIETLFDEKTSQEGDAVGSDFSGTYAVTFTGLTYSSDCTAAFVKATEFYIDQTLSETEINNIIASTAEGSLTTVIITQNNGDLIWDDQTRGNNDYTGVVFSDGVFEGFEGSYLDENNYIYALLQGSVFEGQMSGEFFATISLDGTRNAQELSGTCTVSSEFTGSKQ